MYRGGILSLLPHETRSRLSSLSNDGSRNIVADVLKRSPCFVVILSKRHEVRFTPAHDIRSLDPNHMAGVLRPISTPVELAECVSVGASREYEPVVVIQPHSSTGYGFESASHIKAL